MAVLIGLLMVGVTAGSALAMPVQKEPIRPDDAIGVGAYIKTTLYGFDAIVEEKTISLPPTSVFTKVRYYKVRHNELGGIHVKIYRLVPLTKYAVAFYTPSNLKVWTTALSGAHLINVENKGNYKVITVETNSRFTANIRMGITFNSGYGKHGILVIGHMSTSVLQSYIMSLASAGGIIGGFVATGTTALLSQAVGIILTLASGASLDALIYEEV
ncbi:hypothetical protein [Thermococcus sp. JdF3]|uniref:hypothetical protein n=1 Tax=Thermococcus sp. JdF3 TaxID=1638258 RepID=UPI00143983D7|nr:hypothetical protein [Thermococcus sp. JdF3]NJE02011.1 hypothetical protein [Thermococcus sp. JdF3]